MKRAGFVLSIVAVALSGCASAPEASLSTDPWAVDVDPDRALAGQLSYLDSIERAEAALAAGAYSDALTHAQDAVDLDLAHSLFPPLQLKETSATAHFLKACALSRSGRTRAAIGALESALDAGFTAHDRFGDAHLTAARQDDFYPVIESRLANRSVRDEHAGRTVADPKTGNELLMARQENFPKLGEPAPDFDLAAADGTRRVKLSEYRGRRDVVLVFGSFT